jgi:HK97 family phage major capsid protein
MTIAVPSGNTALTQSQIVQFLTAPLQQKSTFLSAAGLTILDSATPLRIPVAASTSPAAAFVAPGTQITDSGVAFSEVDLLPSTLSGIKVLVRTSNELVRQSALGLEAVLQQRLVEDTALVLDAALWSGAGTSNSIKGILAATGIATGVLDLTDPDSIIDGLTVAREDFVTPTHLVMRAGVFSAFRKLKVSTTDGRYIFDPSAAYGAQVEALFGLPVIISSHVPDNAVAIVDFTHVVVARDLNAEVKILDQTWADFDSIGVRCVTRYDVALTQPKAVTLLTVPAG